MKKEYALEDFVGVVATRKQFNLVAVADLAKLLADLESVVKMAVVEKILVTPVLKQTNSFKHRPKKWKQKQTFVTQTKGTTTIKELTRE